MSDELKQFYREIWAWVKDGCPDHAVFSGDVGLCSNLIRMTDNDSLSSEQSSLFVMECGKLRHPFNEDFDDYLEEADKFEIYCNRKRLAFIEEYAK